MKSGSKSAFRAQLVDPGQRQLFDYWSSLTKDNCLPSRGDISPKDFINLLPKISLIEIEPQTSRYKVRLAGTSYRDIYDREITGAYLEEFEWGEKENYWLTSYARVEEGEPVNGVLPCPQENQNHVLQYWLRLPLSDEKGRVNMILSYDHFTNVEEVLMVPQFAMRG